MASLLSFGSISMSLASYGLRLKILLNFPRDNDNKVSYSLGALNSVLLIKVFLHNCPCNDLLIKSMVNKFHSTCSYSNEV